MSNQGWRFFECYDCGIKWKETCRDHETQNNSACPTKWCRSRLHGGIAPTRSEPDDAIEVDMFGNLVEPEQRVVFGTYLNKQ